MCWAVDFTDDGVISKTRGGKRTMDFVIALINMICMLCISFASNQMTHPTPEQSGLTVENVDIQRLIEEQELEARDLAAQEQAPQEPTAQEPTAQFIYESNGDRFVVPDYETLSKRTIEQGGTPPDLYVIPNPFTDSN